MQFITDYLAYLGIRHVAIKYSLSCHNQLIDGLVSIQKTIRRGNLFIMCLVEVDSSTEVASEVYRGYIDFRRQVHKKSRVAC